jgi:hypothetical protein
LRPGIETSSPIWGRKEAGPVTVTANLNYPETVSTASIPGHPSNCHVSTVRVGGSTSRKVSRNEHRTSRSSPSHAVASIAGEAMRSGRA